MCSNINIELLAILCCPISRQELFVSKSGKLLNRDRTHQWEIIDGRPILYPNLDQVKHHGEHLSNPLCTKGTEFINSNAGLILNLSAGGTHERYPHVVELETAIFRHTDVIGDVHSLPFKDKSFDAVLAMNAFEHYRDPFAAAKEIYRVLKPGGKVLIHTAFLQPLHEPPWHFYNATKYGVLEWFTQFETASISVSENFNPIYALSWFCHQILQGFQSITNGDTNRISNLTLGEVAKFWSDPTLRQGVIWDQFVKLPQHVQETMAAGFEYIGEKKEASSRIIPEVSDKKVYDRMIDPEQKKEFLTFPLSEKLKNFPAMLGEEEKKLPAWMSVKAAAMTGTMVELGCYLGGSTMALLEGALNSSATKKEGKLIHSYDLFTANAFMVEHSLRDHGVNEGESFLHVYKKLMNDYECHIECHAGNILEQSWKGEPINLLYVDILWDWNINQHVFNNFYSSLRPGSTLIHQDYVYSWYPWLPVSMEWLVEAGYFSFDSFAQYSTVSFRCEKGPAGALGIDFDTDLDLNTKRRLLKRSQKRFTGYPKDLLEISEAYLLATNGKKAESLDMIKEISGASAHPFTEHHCEMVKTMINQM
jgi:uncharacterized protein YbaR (Trm112 family)